jgi:hypothetical protein
VRLSLQVTIVIAAIFVVVCFGVAITGYSSLGDIADPVQAADAKGFALFWAFLGTIAVALGAGSLWLLKTGKRDDA